MGKITAYGQIPEFTPDGNYQVDMEPKYLMGWIREEEEDMGLLLNPDFQRGHVWTESQQIAYLEYILRGGKSGRDLYFNNPSWRHRVPPGAYNEYVCVDGLQRITAWQRYFNGEIPVFGSYVHEFTDRFPCGRTMHIHINELPTKEAVLQWYLDMNTGGTIHSEEEIARVRNLLEQEQSKEEYYLPD